MEGLGLRSPGLSSFLQIKRLSKDKKLELIFKGEGLGGVWSPLLSHTKRMKKIKRKSLKNTTSKNISIINLKYVPILYGTKEVSKLNKKKRI